MFNWDILPTSFAKMTESSRPPEKKCKTNTDRLQKKGKTKLKLKVFGNVIFTSTFLQALYFTA